MKEKIKVAFQGAKGAYSHLACLEIFPGTDAVACSTFEEAFQLAKDNSEYKIVIPIENSLAGRVADIHYLIPKYKLQIHSEHFQKVNHNLLGIKGSKLKDIKTVRSHAHALGQSQKFIFDNKLINDFPFIIIGNLIDGILGISGGTIVTINYLLVMY